MSWVEGKVRICSGCKDELGHVLGEWVSEPRELQHDIQLLQIMTLDSVNTDLSQRGFVGPTVDSERTRGGDGW